MQNLSWLKLLFSHEISLKCLIMQQILENSCHHPCVLLLALERYDTGVEFELLQLSREHLLHLSCIFA